MQYEGRIAAKAGINWTTVVEFARLNWLQLLKAQSSMNHKSVEQFQDKLQKTIVDKLTEERLSQVESRLERIEANLSEAGDVTGLDTIALAKIIADLVVESMKSASDVQQREYWKMKKRKF